MYHPAAALHQPDLKKTLLEDYGSRLKQFRSRRKRRQPPRSTGNAQGNAAGTIKPLLEKSLRNQVNYG
jgi:hypothetical protein